MKTIIFIPNITQVNDIGNQVSIQNLPTIIDGSCEDLICYDCLDYVDKEQKLSALDNILKKVRYNGQITLQGTDLEEVTRGMLLGQVSYDDGRKLLYHATNLFASFEIITLLNQKGFEILKKRINNYVYTIIAKRPKPS